MKFTVAQIKGKRFDVVTLCDGHVPFEDPDAISLAFGFCHWLQPAVIVLHEWHDFYAISKFAKDPKRKTELQSELDLVSGYLKELRKHCPNSRIVMLKSNHSDRLKKYLWSKAEELSSLKCLEIAELMGLSKLKIEFRENLIIRDVLFKHGNIIRPNSSYTANGEFTKEGMSGCSGHSHRLGMFFTTKRGGKYVWIESGCLCKKDAEYIEGTANWQQGLSLITFEEKTKQFTPIIIPIIEKSIIFGRYKFFLKGGK